MLLRGPPANTPRYACTSADREKRHHKKYKILQILTLTKAVILTIVNTMSSEQMEKERIAVTVQFPASVARRLAELAKSDKRSFGFVVRESVVAYLDKQEKAVQA